MSRRDWTAEIRDLITKETRHNSYHARPLADEIVKSLRANDPALLLGWLNDNAEQFMYETINRIDRARRAVHAGRARSRAFAEAVEQHQRGNSAPLATFLDTRWVVANGTRKRLGDLNATDVTYIRDGYRRRVRDNLMWASFMDALRAKLERDGGTVEDHYTEEELSTMLRSLSGDEPHEGNTPQSEQK